MAKRKTTKRGGGTPGAGGSGSAGTKV